MTTVTAEATAWTGARTWTPSFWGLIRGEWLKLNRMWTFWIMVALMFGGFTLYAFILSQGPRLSENISHNPLQTLQIIAQVPLFLIRVFWGTMVIVLTARLIGMEYSGGTVRVILSRGVGRLQLLAAQLSVMAAVAVVGGIIYMIYASLLELIGIRIIAGNLNVFNAADATFWSDTRNYALSVLISLGASILMAAAVTAVTRSLAAGLTTAVLWFPVDNLSIIILVLGDHFTHWDFWSLVSGDFLGLNLNVMGQLIISSQAAAVIPTLFEPLTPVTGAHTLLVTAIYAVIFTAVAIGVTFARDVKE
jgi:ABC-type transport system involved in multi-copper enzyme maturation permease subunit